MPKCVRCGKKGIFLHLNQKGECENCEHFMELIHKGFRVYDAYVRHTGNWGLSNSGAPPRYPARISILSKKTLNISSMYRLHPDEYLGVVKNTHAKDCKYITFNGKDIYEYDSSTGKTRKPDELFYERNIRKYYMTSN